jgi:DNA-binding NtrC family response regulator
VLLVDDHRDVRRLATTMLERAGYQVLTASDAEEALVTSRNYDGPIHVLCCDAQMPGLPALRLITDLCAARPTLKVLVCTGERPEGKLAEFPRLSKPFSYQQLVSAVRGCLE